MVGVIYLAFVLIGGVASGVHGAVHAILPSGMDRPRVATVAFDPNKECATVYINSPVDYYNTQKSDKSCVIGVLTYTVHQENEVTAPATIDSSKSASGVLEIK